MIKINEAPNRRNQRLNTNDAVYIKPPEESDIYQFSESVLKELSENNIPSIPSNYSIYFDKMLGERSGAFKEKLGEVILSYEQSDSSAQQDGQVHIEKEIKQSFAQIKSMLQAVALIYKNLGLMKGLVARHLSNLRSNTDILATQNVISAFNEDLIKLNTLMDKHVDVIKVNYEEIGKMFKLIEEQAVYDSTYDIYNKKFLVGTLQLELDAVKRYGYKSSFLLIKADDSMMAGIKNLRDKSLLLKKISSILTKTSRKSDIIGHYGDGIFVIIMRHTDSVGAEQACRRIKDLFLKTVVAIEDKKIAIQTKSVFGTLEKDISMEETLANTLDALEKNTNSEQI
ncbi:GGDEF domain-containing protein [Campylobacter mucosalis]|uniref:GGDEF domain-containing protein n=1 Tax=Campylobacter mucosalis CCUG 21559 TaxID=1032067 RepID=A0A6G5QF59_9BACT|nr:diguanylate cyclase [Campylobacter mucosalis]QCD44136.1 hypothetical protein CMUC_0323 [Campylobacter mucosalis CCUG 21559]